MVTKILKHTIKTTQNSIIEAAFATLAGALGSIVFLRETGWLKNNLNEPFLYFADPLYYVNLVRNAQLGNSLLGQSLGAPGGQQYGLSAYGFEWVQSSVVAWFATANQGPWLAINRFAIFSYFFTGFCAYFSLRLMTVSRSLAIIGAVTFTLIPDHQPYSVGFANMGPLALVLSLLWLIVSGKSLGNIFNLNWNTANRNKKSLLNLCLFFLILTLQLTSAVYFIIFTMLLAVSLILFFLFIKNQFEKIKMLVLFITFQSLLLAVVLTPILFGRLTQRLPFAEPSTGDRRPFAAYANGGDLFSLISPYSSNSLFYKFVSFFPPLRDFYKEYFSSPITLGSEYVLHPGGLTFVCLGIVALFVRKKETLVAQKHPRNYKKINKHFTFEWVFPSLVLLGLSLGWFARGGFGTLLSFFFPYVRGYARFSAILLFLAIAIMCQVASITKKLGVKVLATFCVIIVFIDNSSNFVTITQSNTTSEIRTVGIGELGGAAVVAKDITFRTLGYYGTKELVSNANSLLPANCNVLVLPLVSFPVDFNIGITSYYTLELIKPGLEQTDLKWTSGGLAGTPNNTFSDKWLGDYQQGNYSPFVENITSKNFCGVLIFRGLQDAFNMAGIKNGSNYSSSDKITTLLVREFGLPCYSDVESAVDLFCTSKR